MLYDFLQTLGALPFLLMALALPSQTALADTETVWTIGRSDNDNSEFALAPQDFAQYSEAPFFVIGTSATQHDWPYVLPGPGDAWAGNRQHTHSILFGLNSLPQADECRLVLDLIDTHQSAPSRLQVAVNGHTWEKSLPHGAGDASIMGRPDQGREHVWTIPFPSEQLRSGLNEIHITTLSGSWVLFDSIALEAPVGAVLNEVNPGTAAIRVVVPPVWLRGDHEPQQPVEITLRHLGEAINATLHAAGTHMPVALQHGLQTVRLKLPASEVETEIDFSLQTESETLATGAFTIGPPPLREIWILPHSHVDIGYTHRQDEVIDIQVDHLLKAMSLAEADRNKPSGMRFKWNPEAVWSLDHYLRRATPEQHDRLIEAIRSGDIGVDALYGNMLTALCRPEELAQCLAFGAQLSNLTGVPVESAAICDVPGWTWGMVPIMAQAGVKYFAIGPNYTDRIGRIHVWDNKPFYWEAQSGQEKVLCWVVDNYWHHGDMETHLLAHIDDLRDSEFPYSSSFMFWVGRWDSGAVDNAPPDEQTAEKVVAWNEKYAAPTVAIGLAGDFFRRFEQQYADRIPTAAGDLTPYWEDGAASTARETGMNRASADRLSQATALFAMRTPQTYPAAAFAEAWKNVLLYSEHTWGAWCSISEPDSPFTLDQWRVKQAFALDAERQSHDLLAQALPPSPADATPIEFFDVFNTTQWPRTDLATIPADWSCKGVLDSDDRPVATQRLADGSLVFLAEDVPPFAARRYKLTQQATPAKGRAWVGGNRMRNGELTLELDPETGAIAHLHVSGFADDFVDPKAPVQINDYRYLLGVDPEDAQPNGPVTIRVVDPGPIVATVEITSDAPGCEQLVRQVRLIHGLNRVELINHVDRLSVREKDAIHFGFGFKVPNGQIRMETPWGSVRPNIAQLDGANRNWYTVQRWIDVSNENAGVTCAPLDAPLMQIGAITANLLGSVPFDQWMTESLDSQTLYSWAQNNHWHTNYKADQPGRTTFRYALRPHQDEFDPAETARFGIETTRPLLVAPADPNRPPTPQLLQISDEHVLIETVKPSEDGKALILRLFGVSDQNRDVTINWGDGLSPMTLHRTDLSEQPLEPESGTIHIPAYGVVMLRAQPS